MAKDETSTKTSKAAGGSKGAESRGGAPVNTSKGAESRGGAPLKPVAVGGMTDDVIVACLGPKHNWKEEMNGGMTGMAKQSMTLSMGYESLSKAEFTSALQLLR